MTTDLAFMQAICSDPADDTPRLVYADWLDEHDQPERAAFIRVQCELASRFPSFKRQDGVVETPMRYKDVQTFDDLRRRERELWMSRGWINLAEEFHSRASAHIDQTIPTPWTAPISECFVAIVRRGFVSELRADAATLLGGVCGRCDADGVDPSWTGRDEESSRCTACSGSGRTPGIARELLWWPGATDRCIHCPDRAGLQHKNYPGGWEKCDRCIDGRIPRPMPPTAQPITRVVLTTWPVIPGVLYAESGLAQDLTAEFGPHVEWVLPNQES